MFLVVRGQRGPDWDPSRSLEQQSGWAAHAAFMDDLVQRGNIVLGGPAGERQAVLAFEAGSKDEVAELLAGDPWEGTHLITSSVEEWEIRLDGRPRVGESPA